MYKLTILFLGIFVIMSCGADSNNKSTTANNTASQNQEVAQTPSNTTGEVEQVVMNNYDDREYDPSVPDACTLIKLEDIASIIDVPAHAIDVKDGSNKVTTTTRSCFFRWVDGSFGNSGVLIQVQKNPIPEEYAEWPTLFIESKIKNGEQTFDGTEVNHKYVKWDGIGDAGCYSYEASKYHWRVKDDFVFMIAFNSDVKNAKQLKQATAIAKKVMSTMSNR